MRKFKRIFYILYLLLAVSLLYVSIDALLDINAFLTWYDSRISVEAQPYVIAVLFLILTLSMLIEILVENLHIRRIKNQLPAYEEQITQLKAKLYDQQANDNIEKDEDD